MMIIGLFNTLIDLLVFVMWIFYTMTFLAVFILRKREPKLVRPYKVPHYPFMPIFFIIGGLFIVINTLSTQTLLALCVMDLIALGLPIYYDMRKKDKFNIENRIEQKYIFLC